MRLIIDLKRVKADTFLGLITALMAVMGGVVSATAPSSVLSKTIWILGFGIAGIGACTLIVIQSAKATREHSQLVTEMERNAELQQRVLELGQTNASLAKEGIAATTGGDSYCYMMVNFQFGYPSPMFVHAGEHPLYDVSVRIFDVTKDRKGLSDAYLNITLGEMHHGSGLSFALSRLSFSEEGAQDFNLFFSARNGAWVQNLRLRKIDGKWRAATQLWRSIPPNPQRPIHENVDPAFPRNEDGGVAWDV